MKKCSNYSIYNSDCILGSKLNVDEKSVDLMVCDPPFGIHESKFERHYKRKKMVVEGYEEAPFDYYSFSKDWIHEAVRILKNNGSMYIISGWSNYDIIGRVLRELNLVIINQIIWNFNFGVFTKNKYVTSHYNIFYVKKSNSSKPTFNTYCRFGAHEKNREGGSLLYKDLQSVWFINKEYMPGRKKNQNKLPEELIRKIILYSSNPGNMVCDFFLGSFTTAIVAKKLHRIPMGFEINKKIFDIGSEILSRTKEEELRVPESFVPENQGKPIDNKMIKLVCEYYDNNVNTKSKKDIIQYLMEKFGRGKFSISNIIDKYCRC
jgi:site-specific DNA-methyltransferase (adenine-specific)